MGNYYEVTTYLPIEEIERIKSGLADGSLHPMEMKKRLGEEIIAIYHSIEDAKKAREEFERVFSSESFEIPDEIPELKLESSESRRVVDLALAGSVVKSKSEARRKIREGALRINGEKVDDEMMEVTPSDGDIISVGKRSFVRIKIV